MSQYRIHISRPVVLFLLLEVRECISGSTGFPIKDARLLKYIPLFYFPLRHSVDQEYFSVWRNERLFWETLYEWNYRVKGDWKLKVKTQSITGCMTSLNVSLFSTVPPPSYKIRYSSHARHTKYGFR